MIKITTKENQAYGAFNGGQIVENKPIGFPQDGGDIRPYSTLFYWAYAEANVDSTIGLHPHQGFEIMSFVLKGQIKHYDTDGKKWIPLNQGDVQIIRAGNGISHAEFMAKDAAMFQIWFDPGLQKTINHPASYDDYNLDAFKLEQRGKMEVRILVGENSPIHMESPGVEIKRINIAPGDHKLSLAVDKLHAFYLIDGNLKAAKKEVQKDDVVKIEDESVFEFQNNETLDIFQISSPKELGYATYAELMQAQMNS